MQGVHGAFPSFARDCFLRRCSLSAELPAPPRRYLVYSFALSLHLRIRERSKLLPATVINICTRVYSKIRTEAEGKAFLLKLPVEPVAPRASRYRAVLKIEAARHRLLRIRMRVFLLFFLSFFRPLFSTSTSYRVKGTPAYPRPHFAPLAVRIRMHALRNAAKRIRRRAK